MSSGVKIPVDKKTGHVPDYDPGYNGYTGPCEYVDNWQWEATMRYEGMQRGRSAAHLLWRDASDVPTIEETDWGPMERFAKQTYTMFLQQVDEILNEHGVLTREIHGTWTWVKRGQNFGIKLVKLTA